MTRLTTRTDIPRAAATRGIRTVTWRDQGSRTAGRSGAFGFSGMELETICRDQLPVVTVILNNGGVYRGDDPSASRDPAPTALRARHEFDCVIDPADGTESGNIAHLDPKGIGL